MANFKRSFKTERGNCGGSGREYNLSRQICIVSSSGTFVKREVTSKEHIIPLLYLYVLAQSSPPREFHDLFVSPMYVKLHDRHLTLYTMPFVFVSFGRSFGFLKEWASVFIGLKAVFMFALLSTFLTCSETPFTYGKVAKVFGRVSVSCIWIAAGGLGARHFSMNLSV